MLGKGHGKSERVLPIKKPWETYSHTQTDQRYHGQQRSRPCFSPKSVWWPCPEPRKLRQRISGEKCIIRVIRTLGQQRAQFTQRTNLTWPRPCLFLPWFLRFNGIFVSTQYQKRDELEQRPSDNFYSRFPLTRRARHFDIRSAFQWNLRVILVI